MKSGNPNRFDSIDPLGFYCGYLGKEARRLTPEELDAYDVLDRDLAERVRVLKVPFLPMPGGKGGDDTRAVHFLDLGRRS